ncbi:hypothetical protein ABKU49_23325, partial [Enterobacter hormaechei]
MRYTATTDVVPWTDIQAVVLWHQPVRHTRVAYIGLQRRPGAPPLAGHHAPALVRSVATNVTPVP